MKNKSSKLRLPVFFGQHIHGKVASGRMPTLGKSESERVEAESLIEDILRWEDDGGQIVGIGNAPRPSNGSSTLIPSEPHDR
jgi:hypothetical protein